MVGVFSFQYQSTLSTQTIVNSSNQYKLLKTIKSKILQNQEVQKQIFSNYYFYENLLIKDLSSKTKQKN